MKYGQQRDTTVIDDHGSTITILTKIHEGAAVKPQIKETRIRVKVHNLKEEMKEYLQYTDEAAKCKEQGIDKEPLGFEYEYNDAGRREGFYFVVKSWREVIR